jgi:predicted methyltransferase
MAALSVDTGSRVADVGAGSGYFTAHLSKEVGSSGRVFAVDISDRALNQLARLVENKRLENVEVIRGEIDDPGLPEESLDAVLVVDAYQDAIRSSRRAAGAPGNGCWSRGALPCGAGIPRRDAASHSDGLEPAEGSLRPT